MKFIQILEFQTSRMDEMDELEAKWRSATDGRRTTVRDLKTQDRDRPGTYMVIVEFDSYEDALKNNALSETQEMADAMAKLADGPATFRNLDVLEEHNG